MVHITQKYSFVELMRDVDGVANKEVNSIPYRPVYTVPVSAPVQAHPLFRTRKNTSRIDEIQLFQPVKMFQTGTNKKKKEKEKEEEDEKK